jgi:small-conductance mechanosensitive channel
VVRVELEHEELAAVAGVAIVDLEHHLGEPGVDEGVLEPDEDAGQEGAGHRRAPPPGQLERQRGAIGQRVGRPVAEDVHPVRLTAVPPGPARRREAGTVPDRGYLYELLRRLGLGDFGATTGEFLLVRPLKILLILVVARAAIRLGARTIRRAVRSVHARSPSRSESIRAEQRATTLGDVLASALRVVVWVVAGLVVLDEVGINLAPLIAGAGIAGVALGFGAQSLVKDVISGLFLLLEDQYGVGDVVDLGDDATGTVEDLTLRVTRLRSVDGTVWFVPNGEIRRVGNSSMEWSRALIDVLLAYESDIEAVRGSIKAEADAFATDPAWGDMVLEPPEVWGVQAMGAEGVTVRLVVKTAPRQQYPVARELRTRIYERLRREGVRGPGQTVVVTAGALDQGTPPPPPPEPEPDAM